VGFRDIVTRAESWFLQHYGHRQIWCRSVDEIMTRVARTIAAPKPILTVFLSIDGAILINWLTPGEKFNSGWFCEKNARATFRDPAQQVQCRVPKADGTF
jgi:hypothetical protein